MDGIGKLDELLNDPMIQLVMASDRVKPDEVRVLFEAARERAPESFVPAPYVIDSVCRAWLCQSA